MNKNKLTYYCFDFDDNLLHMETTIHIEKLVNNKWISSIVSTSEFSKLRKNKNQWRYPNNDENSAFIEFTDIGTRGEMAFIEDSISAIKEKRYAPSWNKLIECLVEGNIFAIITARGHEPNTIRKVIQYIIDNELSKEQKLLMIKNLSKFISKFISDRNINKKIKDSELINHYLDKCDFYGVTSEYFRQFCDSNVSNPEKAKEIALKMFTERIDKFGKRVNAKVHIGFSDDDKGNIETVEKLFRNELSLKFQHINFNIYDTSNINVKDGVRIKINH